MVKVITADDGGEKTYLAFFRKTKSTSSIGKSGAMKPGRQSFAYGCFGSLDLSSGAVGGTGTRSYTWYFSAQPGGPFSAIQNVHTATYDLMHAALTDNGYYFVTVCDAYESIDSTTQQLTVVVGVPVAGAQGQAGSDLENVDLRETDRGIYMSRELTISPGRTAKVTP